MSDKQQAKTEQAVAIFKPPRIPYHPAIEQKLGVDQSQWRVLIDSVWPSAKTTDAICLAISYCKARKLDPFKRPVHIVPMWNSQIGQEVETVWPGISEVRTTAARTGEYAGADEAIFGEERTQKFEATTKKGEKISAEVTFPSWCRVTVYRMIKGHRVPFPGPRLMWMETFSWNKGLPVPNARWARAPYQMIEKCAEAAALRKAFPEEIGQDLTAEEMEGKVIDHGAGQSWAAEPAIDVAAEKAAPPPVSVAVDGAVGPAEAPARGTTPAPAVATPAREAAPARSGEGAATQVAKAPAKRAAAAPSAAAEAKKQPADPMDMPAELDRRQKQADAAPQQEPPPADENGEILEGTAEVAPAPEPPADDEPRPEPYGKGPPQDWCRRFLELVGRMGTIEAHDACVQANAKTIAYVKIGNGPAHDALLQALAGKRARFLA